MAIINIVFGPLGAGKTTYARQLSVDEKATCFSIDNWMVDLFGADAPKALTLPWVVERVSRCESVIWSTAKAVAANGGNVVLDLACLKKADRQKFLDLASEAELEAKLHFITASHDTRRARVLSRNQTKGDTFALEVTAEMFDFMNGQFETATEAELKTATTLNTEPT